jgi:hypothetical protein
MEADECEWGWSDESFGFIECMDPSTDMVNIPPGKPIKVCASHARGIRSIWPELNG